MKPKRTGASQRSGIAVYRTPYHPFGREVARVEDDCGDDAWSPFVPAVATEDGIRVGQGFYDSTDLRALRELARGPVPVVATADPNDPGTALVLVLNDDRLLRVSLVGGRVPAFRLPLGRCRLCMWFRIAGRRWRRAGGNCS